MWYMEYQYSYTRYQVLTINKVVIVMTWNSKGFVAPV